MLNNNNQNEITNRFYLSEDRRSSVKQSFKTVAEMFIKDIGSDTSICDIGCATGDFLWYLHYGLNVDSERLCGGDISQEFIQTAKERMPDIRFKQYDIRTPWEFERFDIVTCFGTLYLFDEFQNVLGNLVSIVKDKGRLYIFGHFNNYGYKVKYEYSYIYNGKRIICCDYAHSIEEIGKYLEKMQIRYNLYPFEMSVPIPKKTENPLRVWTETLQDGHYLQIDGIDRIKNQFILEIMK